jgi:hypothetical protein
VSSAQKPLHAIVLSAATGTVTPVDHVVISLSRFESSSRSPQTSAKSSDAPLDARRNPMLRAPKTEHARNQVGTNAADAAAAPGGEDVGRSSQGSGPKAARPTFDAAHHQTQD